MADPAKKTVPPYSTYKSFTNFISGLREHGCPSHITRSLLPGSNSGKAAMGATLRSLDLINSKDEPTEKLKQLVNSEDNYNALLKDILYASYPFLSDGSLDLANTATEKVVEKFKDLGAGGSTISKCMAFFLAAAKDAGIEVSKYVKAPAPDRTGPTRKGKQRSKSEKPPLDPGHDRKPPVIKNTWQEQLLAKFPEFDPSWDEETRKKWFDAFQELMNKGGT